MKSLLLINHIKVENANAIAGITWGFPAVTNFLGFSHALSRSLKQQHAKMPATPITGCAIICHQHQVQAYQPNGVGEYVFSLTRNPLTKEGNTPPFNEEARMHMTVSLLLECDFTNDKVEFEEGDATKCLEQQVLQQLCKQRLAGGTIIDIRDVKFLNWNKTDAEEERQNYRALIKDHRLLPGFMLVDRSNLLAEHYQTLQHQNPEKTMIDAWLDFAALKYKANESAPDKKVEWQHIPKPAAGYLVPLMVGYKGISPLYESAEVANTRDSETPFRFVEAAYGVGQWLGAHRPRSLEQTFWRYAQQGDAYLCKNNYQPDN